MAFREKFSADVKTLYSGITVDPFQLNKLKKINNSTAYFPEVVFDTIREMENIGENQFHMFLNERLIYQKSPICKKISKNNMNLWNHSQHDNKAAYTPSNQVINNMRSAIEYRPELSCIIFT